MHDPAVSRRELLPFPQAHLVPVSELFRDQSIWDAAKHPRKTQLALVTVAKQEWPWSVPAQHRGRDTEPSPARSGHRRLLRETQQVSELAQRNLRLAQIVQCGFLACFFADGLERGTFRMRA